jgi:hypothetical protein
MVNRNAYVGRNVETLFKNSIGDHKDICEIIRSIFKIKGHFVTAISSGVHNEKVDVKIEFSCGRNVDANIKAYKKTIAYNQLTRTTLRNFCEKFNLQCLDLLQDLFIKKAKHINSKLIPEDKQSEISYLLQPIAKDMVEWSMSYKKAREILVLYERIEGIMYIYSMKDVLKNLNYDVVFTSKGNIAIGHSIIIQRKGGNGIHIHGIKDKGDLTHPGNNIQFKLKISDFVKEMESIRLGQYSI